jgi:hypothetical protein
MSLSSFCIWNSKLNISKKSKAFLLFKYEVIEIIMYSFHVKPNGGVSSYSNDILKKIFMVSYAKAC